MYVTASAAATVRGSHRDRDSAGGRGKRDPLEIIEARRLSGDEGQVELVIGFDEPAEKISSFLRIASTTCAAEIFRPASRCGSSRT
jgi:hypothetical protein